MSRNQLWLPLFPAVQGPVFLPPFLSRLTPGPPRGEDHVVQISV